MHLNVFEAVFSAAAVLAGSVASIGLMAGGSAIETVRVAETVEIESAVLDFPLPGEFLVTGQPVAAPVERVDVPRFRIMKHQVGLADYGRCVDAGDCQPAE